ncbi:MAG: hypothetical protein J4452_01395 [Candidatus Aenigmarchaeota archaeon]|nr:hypothetical protein [Candidatus Aenigmarchaeota archaeon]
MALTLHDITPVGLCVVTGDLFDARRFQSGFCDNTIMKTRDEDLKDKLVSVKRELNSYSTEKKFLDGHKSIIVSNMDKINALVISRFVQQDLKAVESIVVHSKDLMTRVLNASSFDDISALETTFRTKVSLPVYDLFLQYMKKSNIPMV